MSHNSGANVMTGWLRSVHDVEHPAVASLPSTGLDAHPNMTAQVLKRGGLMLTTCQRARTAPEQHSAHPIELE